LKIINRQTAIFIGILMLCNTPHAHAAVLKGVVLADELGGPRIAGVEITTAGGEAHTVTNAKGLFKPRGRR